MTSTKSAGAPRDLCIVIPDSSLQRADPGPRYPEMGTMRCGSETNAGRLGSRLSRLKALGRDDIEGGAGFTLLEVTAVMLIIALVASLVVTLMPATGRTRLKAVALESASLIRRERLGAILTGSERQVSLDSEERALVGDGGDRVALPSDVVLDVLGTSELMSGRQTVVRFGPDGASTGAVLRLRHDKTEYEIRVNWYTGGVSIIEP